MVSGIFQDVLWDLRGASGDLRGSKELPESIRSVAGGGGVSGAFQGVSQKRFIEGPGGLRSVSRGLREISEALQGPRGISDGLRGVSGGPRRPQGVS